MKRLFVERVMEAVKRANWRKGYGDIAECRVFLDGTIHATIRRPFMRDTIRKGRVEGNRVRFASTTATLENPD